MHLNVAPRLLLCRRGVGSQENELPWKGITSVPQSEGKERTSMQIAPSTSVWVVEGSHFKAPVLDVHTRDRSSFDWMLDVIVLGLGVGYAL